MKRTSIVRGRMLPDAQHLARLDDAQELGLQGGRQLADFVEEYGSARSRLEQAGLRRACAGERAPLVAEQLALQQRLATAPRS